LIERRTDDRPASEEATELMNQLRAERAIFRAAIAALRAEFSGEVALLRSQAPRGAPRS
jgi:hypothetical protein